MAENQRSGISRTEDSGIVSQKRRKKIPMKAVLAPNDKGGNPPALKRKKEPPQKTTERSEMK